MFTKVATNLREAPNPGVIAENKKMLPGVERLQRRIAEVAYFKAEKRGFTAGHEAEDWLEAESEVLMSEFTD